MSFSLTAVTRQDLGRQAKKVRKSGFIPAVMYGPGITPKNVQVGVSEFQKLYRAAGSSSLIDMTVDSAAPVKVLIQEVQLHHLTRKPNHIDLRQIRMDEELVIDVALVFQGEAPAVKELAGTLMHAYDTLTVRCLPADLPHEITIDLSTLKTFDDSITVADLKLPKGVVVEQAGDVTIASVTPPLTDEQLKKLEESSVGDVTAVKTEAEEKKAQDEAKKAAEAAAEEAAK